MGLKWPPWYGMPSILLGSNITMAVRMIGAEKVKKRMWCDLGYGFNCNERLSSMTDFTHQK